MNHKNRSWAFALLLGVLGAHMATQTHGMGAWFLLTVQFLVYPQLAYWVAQRSAEPLQAELHNMRADALCFGAWMAVLQFPLWISFAMFTGASLNMAAFKGIKGYLQSLGLLLTGTALGALSAGGWGFSPDTSMPVTFFSMTVLSLYLLASTQDYHRRSVSLSQARRNLRANEQALQQQLSEINSLQEQLREQANRDSLTGLYNRRYLDSTLGRELARCAREKIPACLMLLDLDHFKQINDTHGHPAGDAVLVHLAQQLTEHSRADNLACRYGGEEFLLWLPGVSAATAHTRAETLRQRFAEQQVQGGNQAVTATLSVGLAMYPEHGITAETLIQHADQALYRAKSQGRNRVVAFRPSLDKL